MQLPKYGSWEPDDFYQAVYCLGPAMEATEEEIREWVEDLKNRGHLASFKEAYTQFLLDDSMSLAQKDEIYLDGVMNSDLDTWKFFHSFWNIIAPGEPWPLEGRPAPEKK